MTPDQQAAARARHATAAAAGSARQARDRALMTLEDTAARHVLGEVEGVAVEAAEHALDAAERRVRRLEAALVGLRERAPTY